MSRLYTIGYEGRSQCQLVGALVAAGVEQLLDVRWRPLSRKPGLSKTALSAACAEAGIAYLHDRRLGTPPELLRRLRDEGTYDWDAYAAHLTGEPDALRAAAVAATVSPVALLCYEADPADCHRFLVARRVSANASLTIEHL